MMQKAFKLDLNIDMEDGSLDWCEIRTFIIEDDEGEILNIKKDGYTPTKGDKFYFLPGVSIPRVKLKDLTRDYGVKSTRNLQDATHIFAGRSTQHKVSDTLWVYKIPTEQIEYLYEHYKSKSDQDDYYLDKLRHALDANEYSYVFMDYSTASLFRNNKSEVFQTIRDNIKDENGNITLKNSNYIYTIDEDFVEDMLEIEKLNIPIIDESCLLKHINGDDATTIDEEVFQQLGDMLNSSDTDNHTLAMEIMANSNYLDSLLYLELLFKEYAYYMERCRSKNHVNFKGLLAFLGKDKSNMSTSLDEVVRSLKANDVLTIDKLNYLLGKYSKEISDHGNTDIFLVKSVTVNDEVLKDLNCNYTYKTIADPEEVVQMCDELIDLQMNESDTESSETNEDTVEEVKVEQEPENSGTEKIEENNGDSFDWF